MENEGMAEKREEGKKTTITSPLMVCDNNNFLMLTLAVLWDET